MRTTRTRSGTFGSDTMTSCTKGHVRCAMRAPGFGFAELRVHRRPGFQRRMVRTLPKAGLIAYCQLCGVRGSEKALKRINALKGQQPHRVLFSDGRPPESVRCTIGATDAKDPW